MKNKIYLIQYTSGNDWEKEKGICIITAENRKQAVLTFTKTIEKRRITNVFEIRIKKGIIFNQDVSAL